jgi:hypothetical protein
MLCYNGYKYRLQYRIQYRLGNKNIRLLHNIGEVNMKRFIYSFIPQYVPNRIVIYTLELLRIVSTPFMTRKKIDKNKLHNIGEISKPNCEIILGKFIENQARLGSISFGNGKQTNMSYSGCEVIAVYNAQLAMGKDVSGDFLINLISYFEKKGSVLNGEFGTSPIALYRYFKKNNYNTLIQYSPNPNKINSMGKSYETFIATFYNDKFNISKMIHTVCITKNKNGEFTAHNAYIKNQNGNYTNSSPIVTLTETINQLGTNPKIICMIGIGKK